MKLRRISQQSPENIRDFYIYLKNKQPNSGKSRFQAMIDLIDTLEMQKPDYEYWVYTYNENLVLTRSDTMGSGIAIEPLMGTFVITYPLKSEKAPWKHALVEGLASNIPKAIQMIHQALEYLNM